jgi:hypothetical protein
LVAQHGDEVVTVVLFGGVELVVDELDSTVRGEVLGHEELTVVGHGLSSGDGSVPAAGRRRREKLIAGRGSWTAV